MQIVEVDIKNFRGIKTFKQSFYNKKLVCLIGRGDSGKSTILDAIAYALSPNWNVPFNDNDFYNGDTSTPITIDISIIIPENFLPEDKYGMYLRGWDKTNNKICNELKEDFERIITIRLEVADDLEPHWYVFNECQEETKKDINNKDRAKLNCFMISDYLEKHFTWGSGTPLYAISKGDMDLSEYNSKFIKPIRDAVDKINENDFSSLNKCFEDSISSELIPIANTKTKLEARDVHFSISKLSLHDKNGIPYRLKGKGSKRLLSTTIQLATAKEGGITLIDEIEQGLEPDRIKKLVNLIKTTAQESDSQIFITTHSNNVITELGAENIIIIRRNDTDGTVIAKETPKELIDIVRACSEAFFAKKVIVCEGKTEVGICRAIDNYLKANNRHIMSYYGCIAIEGTGSNFAKRSQAIKNLGFETLVLCDSDIGCTPSKEDLKKIGVILCDCEEGNKIETQIFKDIPYEAVKEIVQYAIEERYNSDESHFFDSAKAKNSEFPSNWKDNDCELVRKTIADVSTIANKEWFKRIDRGEELGNLIFKYFDNINNETCLKKQLNQIMRWIES